MHPSEQPYQEYTSQQTYGMYMGEEQAYREQKYEQEQSHDGTENWRREEKLTGEQRQQHLYEQSLYSTPTRLVLDGRFFAALSYSLCWFSAIIMLFFGWKDRFVRFHALQSLFFFGVVNLFDLIMLRILFSWHHMHVWILPILCVFFLVNLIAAIAWVIGMLQAGLGNYYQLPVVGDMILRKFVRPGSVKK